MTIDERLDRLTERHEALTQTVELMAHMQQEAFAKHELTFEKHDRAQEKNEVLMARIMESINDLARIAHVHEQRISDVEKRRT
jgi:hypothetical protein